VKIGDLAKRLGTSVSSLRFYEQKGLVRPSRTEGGTRQYDEDDFLRFKALLELASLDVPLDRIRALTLIRASSATGDAASRKVDKEFQYLEEVLTATRKRIEHALRDIKQARHRLTGCHDCNRQPIRSVCQNCSVAPGLLECQIMRVAWDEEQR